VRMWLLASHLVLVLLLGIVMSVALANFLSVTRGIDRVLEGNYKSIRAAQQMQQGLMLDLAGFAELILGNRATAKMRFESGKENFVAGQVSARQAINEPGEREVLERIQRLYGPHRELVERAMAQGGLDSRSREEFEKDESESYEHLRHQIEALVQINEVAMTRESQNVKLSAQTAALHSMIVAGCTLALAVILTVAVSRTFLRPLRILAKRADQIGQGNFEGHLHLRSRDELGALAKAFNVMSDRLKEARSESQHMLHRAQKMSDEALESLYDPVIVTDAEGRMIFFNKAAEGLFGPSPATPRNPIIQHLGDEMIMEAIYRAIQQDVVLAPEDEASLVPIRVGDKDRTYRMRATPMKDDDGQMLGSVTVLEDVTHLREIDRLKSEFIGVASHELRTPVASLLMSVQLLEEGAVGELTEGQRQVVALQKEELLRLKRLMNELLDLSKLEAGSQPMRFSMVDPAAMLRGAVAPLKPTAYEKNVRLHMELDPELKPVAADRSQIERVLVNLISNAIRHTSSGGNVTVRATMGQDQVTFSVEDDGEGIPKEYLAKIFDRFVQVPGATGGGAGLGLSIAHNIVKAHGGTIWAESNTGEGSAFHFALPTGPGAAGESTP
jgi:NtrC-family two-component system sensor histidine kinase KinB